MQGKLVTSWALLCFWEAEQRRCSRLLFVAATLSVTLLSALSEAIATTRQRKRVSQGRVEIVHHLSRCVGILETSSVLLVTRVS